MSMNIIRLGCEESQAVFKDLADTFNHQAKTLTELAVARKGGSAFYKASYHLKVDPDLLATLAASGQNVAFLSNCDAKFIAPPYGTLSKRRAKNAHISKKKIISFDLDFKDWSPEFSHWNRKRKYAFAEEIAQKISLKTKQLNLPVWMMVYSGGGLHFHFKTSQPVDCKDAKAYTRMYHTWAGMLQRVLEIETTFDTSCCNSARLMRLPLSTNHKSTQEPVPTEVWHWNPDADAASFLQIRTEEPSSTNLSLVEVLKHFGYSKFETLREHNQEILCSSPFTSDSKPSFYFHPQKQVYYDFSSGQGGSLRQLIQRLSQKYPNTPCDHMLQQAKPRRTGIPTKFALDSKGVWYLEQKDDEQPEVRRFLAAPLQVKAMSRDFHSGSWGRVLEFKDFDGNAKQWAVPARLLIGDPAEFICSLAERGLELAADRRNRSLLVEYVLGCKPSTRARCVDKMGWHGGSYVHPHKSYASQDSTESIHLQTTKSAEAFNSSGTLKEWQERVAQPCKGQSRLMLALSTAFAAPALHLLGCESGGVHFVGSSSIGKTLCLRVAASVWGSSNKSSLINSWRSTVNGLEHLASAHNDGLLLLDELAEISPVAAGRAAYMLANGSGKQRLDKDGNPKPCASWRTLFLSTGEIGLKQHFAESGETLRGGHSVRFIELEADAGKGFGVFDVLPENRSAAQYADQLELDAKSYGGSAIHRYLQSLSGHTEALSKLRQFQKDFLSRLEGKNLTRQACRVAKRFAMIGASGALAAELDILPWDAEESLAATLNCFETWLSAQPQSDDLESADIIERTRSYLATHGLCQFPLLDGYSADSSSHKVSGFRRSGPEGKVEFYFMIDVFREQVCKGFSWRKALSTLARLGYLHRSGKAFSRQIRCKSLGKLRVYQIDESILSASERSM